MIRFWLFFVMTAYLSASALVLPRAAEAAENQPSAEASSTDGDLYLPPIVVTATRVLRDLKEIPLSVSVMGEEEM